MAQAKKLIAVVLMAMALLTAGADGVQGGAEEERVKALYLYNFLLFVDWPEEAGQDRGIFRVCIAGDEPLFRALTEISGGAIKGRSLVIGRVASVQDLDAACHVLFIGKSEGDRAGLFIEKVRGRPALTLSDMEGFAEMGGMVCFRRLGRPEQKDASPNLFDINLSAVQGAGLLIRSRLLRLSNIVK